MKNSSVTNRQSRLGGSNCPRKIILGLIHPEDGNHRFSWNIGHQLLYCAL